MTVRTAVHRSVPMASLPDFTPVPRKVSRHDGWTPERQIAFIHALADTGCVSIAARMVNMSPESAYLLRRQPGAESFRRAWDAAQSFGLQRVKDEAFDRAMNGEMIPVFVAGKLMGFRRKKSDRLLMFILRHYGQDAEGRKTTINYFSTRATAGAASSAPSPLRGEGDSRSERGEGQSGALASAESSTTTVKTVITGGNAQPQALSDDEAANTLNAFAGVELDAQAQDQIYQALAACAERRRALEADPENDPERFFIGAGEAGDYLGTLESGVEGDWVEYREPGEHRWEDLGEGGQAEEIDRVVGEMEERLASETSEARKDRLAAEDALIQAQYEKANRPLPGCAGGQSPALPGPALSEVEGPALSEVEGNDPRLDWRNWSGGQGGHALPPPAHPESVEAPSPPGGRGIEGEGDDQPISPRTGKPVLSPSKGPRKRSPEQGRRTYKKRTPKPPFTPPDEARKAEAVAEVEAERRELAAAEAERRRAKQERGVAKSDPERIHAVP